MLKVGIVGCGNIFTMHATSCDHLKNATLVGVCDIKKDRADKAAQKYGVQAYYEYLSGNVADSQLNAHATLDIATLK